MIVEVCEMEVPEVEVRPKSARRRMRKPKRDFSGLLFRYRRKAPMMTRNRPWIPRKLWIGVCHLVVLRSAPKVS